MSFSLQSALVVSSIFFLFTICPFTASETPPVNQSIGSNVSTPTPNQTNSVKDAQWEWITKTQAQTSCLSQARQYAVQSGYSASMVYSCRCTATETEDTKQYQCTIATANPFNPNKPVSIKCMKSARTCTISSSGISQTFTFDELEKIADQQS